MFRFIETIRLENGHLPDLSYHQARVDRALREVVGQAAKIDLFHHLSTYPLPPTGLHKIRVVYDDQIRSVEISSYSIRPVTRLKLVESPTIAYPHKFENRAELESLFQARGPCVDIIITKNNEITDASMANLLFKRGNKWVTPVSYLLNGTMRKHLLDKKIITEDRIQADDLPRYEKVKLINAMMPFDGPEIDVSNIVQ